MSPDCPTARLLASMLLACLVGNRLYSHGIDIPLPEEGENPVGLSAPIDGLEPMLAALAESPYPLLNSTEVERLQGISQMLEVSRSRISGETGFAYELAGKQFAFHQRLASQQILELLEQQDELLTLDWKAGTRDERIKSGTKLLSLRDTLLLKVIDGEGPVALQHVSLNLSFSGDPGPIRLNTMRGGSTYYLLSLDEIPVGRSGLQLQFHDTTTGTPFQWETVFVETETPGYLAVRIEGGAAGNTSIHLRLEKADGTALWAPPNAVDLGPIMTRITGLPIYGPGGAVTHYMPGSWRGVYWLVPGSFETAIPPGKWRVVGHKGYESTLIDKVVEITPGEHTAVSIQPERWIDMPERGWWSGDDHVHGRLLHSEDAHKLLTYAEASDIHVANVLEMGNQVRSWYSQRGFGPNFRAQRGSYVLVPGQEDPRGAFGHALGLNLTGLARFPDQYMLYDLVADEVHRQGGLYGHTHVGEGGLGIERDMTLLIPRGKSDFASIMQNVLGTERYYPFLNLGYRLTASAGSDVPYGGVVGVTRVYAWLGEGEPFDVDRWFEVVKGGNTFVSNGPMIELTVGGKRPGESIELDGTPINVKANVHGLVGESAPTLVELIVNGSVQESAVFDGRRQSVMFAASLEEAYGCWIALRVTGANGSQAHTTPVYAARPGFRHWDFEHVPKWIQERRETLAEIAAMVDEQEAAAKAGLLSEMDIWNRPMAEQAVALRERIRFVSGLYDDLLKQWEFEKSSGRSPTPQP